MKRGFDKDKYILAQTRAIKERVKKFKRLYLEFGGKLIYDEHASRVLPGYKKTTKVEILKKLGKIHLIYCVNSKDLSSQKVLGEKMRTYSEQVLKDLKDIKKFKLNCKTIAITRFEGEKRASEFADELKKLGKDVYFFNEIPGYENPKKAIAGYKKQVYIPIKENLIILTGPAGGSGKMSVALNQIYFENKKKMKAGFAKFETFPIWNLSITHPINLAYEAGTADLQDKLMIDKLHKKAYGIEAVNYNRDLNNFEILKELVKEFTKKKFPFGYKSATDMGVNMAKVGIINDSICRKAAKKEIKRRYKYYLKEFKQVRENKKTVLRAREVLRKVES